MLSNWLETTTFGTCERAGSSSQLKGLILAQNERWRRGLGMQVEREPLLRERGERQTG